MITIEQILEQNNNSEKISGIYEIKNKYTEKYYIGESLDIYNRWKVHISDLNMDIHINSTLQNDYNKYGKEAFEFNIIQDNIEYEKDSLSSHIAKLLLLERMYIALYEKKHIALYNKHETLKEFLNADYKDNDLFINDIYYIKSALLWYLRNFIFKISDSGFIFIKTGNLGNIIREKFKIGASKNNTTQKTIDYLQTLFLKKYNDLFKERHLSYSFTGEPITETLYIIKDMERANELLFPKKDMCQYIYKKIKQQNKITKELNKITKEHGQIEEIDILTKENEEIEKELHDIMDDNYDLDAFNINNCNMPNNKKLKKSTFNNYINNYYKYFIIEENGINGVNAFGDIYSIYYYLHYKYDLPIFNMTYMNFKNMLINNGIIYTTIKNTKTRIEAGKYSINNNFIDHYGSLGAVYFNKKGISYIENLFISKP